MSAFSRRKCSYEECPNGCGGRKHHLADLVVSSILIAGLPSRGMSLVVTELPFAGRHLTGGSASTPLHCAARFPVSFFLTGHSHHGKLPPQPARNKRWLSLAMAQFVFSSHHLSAGMLILAPRIAAQTGACNLNAYANSSTMLNVPHWA
jgi:hypothetical protein